MIPGIDVDRVLQKLAKPLLATEVRPALEVAYLAMAADRSLRDEEYQAFEQMALHVTSHVQDPDASPYRAGSVDQRGVEMVRRIQTMLDDFAVALDREGTKARLASAAAGLTRPAARDLAYQLAFLMTISDLDTNDLETRFEDRSRRALELSDDWAEALVDEVLGLVDGRDA